MQIGPGFSDSIGAHAPALSDGSAALPLPQGDERRRGEDRRFDREPTLTLTGHLLLPVTVFVVTVLTLDFSHLSNFIVTIWPSNAVILVALLRHKRCLSNYASILAGGAAAIALAAFISGTTPISAAILGVTDALEVAVVLALMAAFRIDVGNFMQFKTLLLFIVIAGGIAPIGSDAIAAMAVASAYNVPWRLVWLHLYPAHAIGMIIVAPFLISVTSPDWYEQHLRHRVVEAAAVLALIVAIAATATFFRPFVFVIVPGILFATLRFGVAGATMATLMTAVIGSFFVVSNVGEPLLMRTALPERIQALQVILAFTSLWSLPTAALLTERDRLLGDLSLANSQLKMESEKKTHLVVGLRRHLSIAEEKERLRLSYELHDQAGQGLIAAILELNEIDAQVDDAARERLHQVRRKMEELGKTLHRIAWELRPPSIDELGLRKALASYIADWAERCDTEVDFHCDDPNLDDISNEIGTTIYRVVQEALTNVLKHAGRPSDVSVVIRRVAATLQVIIEDNGCGFDVSAVNGRAGGYRGLGLDGMRERLLLIGGTLEIESVVGAGTTLFARIMLESQRSAA